MASSKVPSCQPLLVVVVDHRAVGALRARIHRGAAEIGGNCVELEARGRRIVLDLGRPLWAAPGEELPLPPIAGLSNGADPDLVGVVLSHAHLDHYGLIEQVHPAVPLYVGAAAARILKQAAFFTPAGLDREWAGFLTDRKPLELGPFTVIPFLVDHSAFDAYALLIEVHGRRLFYSGDLRSHGRDATIFERLLTDPPSGIDVLLLEGTRVNRGPDHVAATEADVERQFTELLMQADGMLLVAYSAQNIDRLVTLYRATLNSARELVIDPYVGAIANASGHPGTPSPGSPGILVYVPQSQRIRIKRSGEFERVNQIRAHRIFPEALCERRRNLVLTFRPSMAIELERAKCLDGASVAWSMWPGYLKDGHMRGFHTFLKRHRIPLTVVHASGHATVADLQRLAKAFVPGRVVPIHTSAPERYAELFAAVEQHPDGEWWNV